MSTGIPGTPSPHALLGRPALRHYLEGYVRRRVRPCDADDTVQAVLCAALEARRIPEDDEELRRWVTGIARKKIAALWARASRSREETRDTSEAADDASPPVEELALVEWAEREAAAHGPEAARTLAWMAREGEGEKLESIAAEAREPATLVRQRVSRMRRWLRTRWTAELAAAVGVIVAVAVIAGILFAECASVGHGAPRMIAVPDEGTGHRVKELREPAPDRLAPPPMLPAAPSATPVPTATPPWKRPSKAGSSTPVTGSSL